MQKPILVLALLALLAAPAAAGEVLSFQGRLTGASGDPLNGFYRLTFRVYDAKVSGNLLWTEVHASVEVKNGIYVDITTSGTVSYVVTYMEDTD